MTQRRSRPFLLCLLLAAFSFAHVAAAQAPRDPAAAAALEAALARTGAVPGYRYQADIRIVSDDQDTFTFAVQGEGASSPGAFSYRFTGTLATEGGSLAIDSELRALGPTVYVRDAARVWQAFPLSEAVMAVDDRAQVPAGFDVSALGRGELAASSPAWAVFTQAWNDPETADAIGIREIAPRADRRVFQSTIALDTLLMSEGGISFVQYLLEIADQSSAAVTIAPTRQNAIFSASVLAAALESSTFTLTQEVDADSLIRRAELTGAFNYDPALLNQAGQPLALTLQATVQLDYDTVPTVVVPANADGSTVMVGSAAPFFDALTVTLGGTPTAAETRPAGGGTGALGAISSARTQAASVGSATVQPLPTPTQGASGETGASGTGASGTGASGTASPGDKLVPGVPVVVVLGGDGPVDLTYQTRAGESIAVTVRSLETQNTLDPTVEVLDADSQRVAYNDDHGSTANTTLARLDSRVEVTLDEAAALTVRVNTFSGAQRGRVEVVLVSDEQAAPPDAPEQTGTLVLSTTPTVIRDAVPPGGEWTGTFTAQAGQFLTLSVRSRDARLDPRVFLRDAAGTTLAQNDDHAGDDPALDRFDSQIAEFLIPADGTYTMTVNGFSGGSGPFELTLVQVGQSDDAGPQPTPAPTSDTAAVVVNETLGAGETYVYTFAAEAGDLYTITARSESEISDLALALRDFEDGYVADNDLHGSSDTTLALTDARIHNVLIAADGEYTVYVRDQSGGTVAFELTIAQTGTGIGLEVRDERLITSDLATGGVFEQTIALDAGTALTVIVRGLTGTLDPRVSLISPSGEVVFDNDDNGAVGGRLGFYDSLINNYVVEEAGTYTIAVTGYGETAGTFALVTQER